MRTHVSDSSFAKLYLWASRAKYTMGLFFVAFEMVYFAYGFLNVGMDAVLRISVAMQMLVACFLIGIAQQLFLPENELSFWRGLCWIATSVAIMLLFCLGFDWFAQFPSWCMPVFVIGMILGMVAMIMSHYFQLHRESKQLNQKLAQFQRDEKQYS